VETPAPKAAPEPLVADPTPLGLIGLSVGCAALLPLAFGQKAAATPDGLRLAAMFCLLFGAGGQLLAGLMSFLNKNVLGGTLFTAFSFNWIMNYWSLTELSQGRVPNGAVVLSVDACFLLVFLVMSVAFGFHGKLLLAFLVDIDLLYVCRIARELLHMPSLGLPIALFTVGLMAIALYLAFALVLNAASGRTILPIGGPAFGGAKH
jgi:succinate-acetate transporter protein